MGVRNRILKRICYPLAGGAIAQTERARKYMETLIDPDKVVVIPNPVNIITTVNVPPKNVIITVGRL